MGAYNEEPSTIVPDDIEDPAAAVRLARARHPLRERRCEGKVEAIDIIGFQAADRLVNSEYDGTTKTITSYPKWRGIGDASSTGKWIFRNGDFTLVQYEVDASYDDEINPETVLDYDTAP